MTKLLNCRSVPPLSPEKGRAFAVALALFCPLVHCLAQGTMQITFESGHTYESGISFWHDNGGPAVPAVVPSGVAGEPDKTKQEHML